jgi:hypothetical protein
VYFRCWHRLGRNREPFLCRNCGTIIEQCPCVQWRVADDKCNLCRGSGWLATLRGNIGKFKEYLERVA